MEEREKGNPFLWMLPSSEEWKSPPTYVAIGLGIAIAVMVGNNVDWPLWGSAIATLIVYITGMALVKMKFIRNIWLGGFAICLLITILQAVGL